MYNLSSGLWNSAVYNILTYVYSVQCIDPSFTKVDKSYRTTSIDVTLFFKHSPCVHPSPQYQPPVIGRSQCGFVGLKNAGATCYMNSVLQQLYMTKPIRDTILSVEIEQSNQESQNET